MIIALQHSSILASVSRSVSVPKSAISHSSYVSLVISYQLKVFKTRTMIDRLVLLVFSPASVQCQWRMFIVKTA